MNSNNFYIIEGPIEFYSESRPPRNMWRLELRRTGGGFFSEIFDSFESAKTRGEWWNKECLQSS